jgi:hypothetical protein
MDNNGINMRSFVLIWRWRVIANIFSGTYLGVNWVEGGARCECSIEIIELFIEGIY